MITNQSSNRVQYRTLITVLFLGFLGYICFVDFFSLETGSCCVVLAGLVLMATLHHHTPCVVSLCLLHICENQLCIYV